MQKAIMFRAYNGVEIIDTRPEAEISYSNMKYAEELASKRKQKKETKNIKILRKYYLHCFRKETKWKGITHQKATEDL